MKSYNLVYFLSLISIATAMFIIVENPESGRINLIAGFFALIGFIGNIIGFLLKKS